MTTPGTSTEPGTTKPGTTKPGTTKTGTTILEYDQAWNDHWSTLEMDQAVKCSGPNTWPFPGYVAFFQAWSFLAWSFQAWSCTVSQCTAFKGTVPRSHKHWRELPTFATLFLSELPQVGDSFFAALAVRVMVVRTWHIAAGTDAQL
jgi:hypothetical protein